MPLCANSSLQWLACAALWSGVPSAAAVHLNFRPGTRHNCDDPFQFHGRTERAGLQDDINGTRQPRSGVPTLIGYILEYTGNNWALAFYASAAIYFLGAIWLDADRSGDVPQSAYKASPPLSTFSGVKMRDPSTMFFGAFSPFRIFNATSIASAAPFGYWNVALRMPCFT